jgi:hypothetical protein
MPATTEGYHQSDCIYGHTAVAHRIAAGLTKTEREQPLVDETPVESRKIVASTCEALGYIIASKAPQLAAEGYPGFVAGTTCPLRYLAQEGVANIVGVRT